MSHHEDDHDRCCGGRHHAHDEHHEHEHGSGRGGHHGAGEDGDSGFGPAGACVCTKCGHKIPHHRGVPCREERCPECGAKMLRQGSEHHRLWEAKRAGKQSKRGEGGAGP